MLNTMWWNPTWSGSAAGDARSDVQSDFSETPSSVLDNDTENELTQFPVYGSSSNSSRMPENRTPTAQEWLQLGVGLGDDDETDAPVSSTEPQPTEHNKKTTTEDWEESLWHTPTTIDSDPSKVGKIGNNSNTNMIVRKNNPEAPSSPNTTIGVLDRQHWMPDKLCKQCSACEVPFTVFRRRHHCRWCGHVFCNACSAHFVPYNHTTQRVCRLCHDHLVKDDEKDAKSTTTAATASTSNNNSKSVSSVSTTTNSNTSKNPLKPPSTHGPLGMAAAQHLECLAAELLRTHAPLLWNSSLNRKEWISQLLTLATRCCSTVDPNVRKGDLLDIRPYVKIKRVSGGKPSDCAYLSGVVFRKTVAHKRMAKSIRQPKILLLAGSLDFYARVENNLASLDTLFEQETKYLEILVNKILKLKPDIVLVGRSASRKAQDMLLKADVVLIQHVKASLLSRIARQTGATVISSTDHIMSQFGSSVLGHCQRFRLVTFRDNEVYDEHAVARNSVEREAALCARQLGEKVWDGALAVKCGLAKRGVARTYVMLEGCPKHLGCTVVLRGTNREALAQVKVVLRFLVYVAYNLRLETSYLRERGAALPEFRCQPAHAQSSSIAVDFGPPPAGKTVRPWNGGSVERSETGDITAFEQQSILITSVWMADKSQCCPAEVKGICYYSLQDVALGQFLRDSCFNLSLKCQNANCKKSVLDHSLSFVHNDGLINITVEEMGSPLPGDSVRDDNESSTADEEEEDVDKPIATWTYCKVCRKVVTPLVFISENTWRWSFGKFLEVYFYNHDTVLQNCGCNLRQNAVLYFGCGILAARFTYETVHPYGVFVRNSLPIALGWHRREAMRRLDMISVASSDLFVKFDKHIEKVSREARSLFHSANNRPEHLQTVLSELNRIGSEVDLASKTIQEKIASVSENFRQSDENDTILRFPGLAKRYLFMLMSAWNEKLSAVGQTISAMKKLAGALGTSSGDPLQEELLEGMRRLKELNEQYEKYNVIDITQSLPSLPNQKVMEDDEDDDEPHDATIDFSDGVDADVLASRRRLVKAPKPSSMSSSDRKRSGGGRSSTHKGPSPTKTLGTRRATGEGSNGDMGIPPKSTPGGAVKSAITRFFNRGGRDHDPYVIDLGIFKEGRPRLSPGVNGIVVPVIDEQLSTIIAYALVSPEYAKHFKHHWSKIEIDADDGQASVSGDRPSKESKHPLRSKSNKSTNDVERRMLHRRKSHIKITFRDYDEKGRVTCKVTCTSFWSTQFHSVREVFLAGKNEDKEEDIEQSFIESLSAAYTWAASGGKSGASFARTNDDRFVMKNISRTELQMFLESSNEYFEYLSKAFFHGLPTVLCKIVGVYQVSIHNRVTGRRTMEQVAVMQNIFYGKKITKTFDLKGSLRGRFAAQRNNESVPEESSSKQRSTAVDSDNSILDGIELRHTVETKRDGPATLLDGDFLEETMGRPMPLTDRAKALFQMSILNDTLFLSIINVLDYSILIGVDDDSGELVVGIIDFMRQYDLVKQMERVGKSLPMVVGSEAPTIIQPPLYKTRFTNAMERYFMTVPSKWTAV